VDQSGGKVIAKSVSVDQLTQKRIYAGSDEVRGFALREKSAFEIERGKTRRRFSYADLE
jgi:hypothetical protein